MEKKIANESYDSGGLKKGRTASTRRSRRASKRGAKAKVQKQLARDNESGTSDQERAR